MPKIATGLAIIQIVLVLLVLVKIARVILVRAE